MPAPLTSIFRFFRGDEMSTTPDSIVRQWFKEVWDEGREEVIDQLAAPDAIVHGLSGPSPMIGTEPFKNVFRTFREALGDLEIAVERTVVEGDVCAAYCRVKGRHVGHALGGAPTGNPVEFNGVTIARTRDGKIVEGWSCFDFLTMYQQIGWVKNPPVP
jgi:predicted ester cyclase